MDLKIFGILVKRIDEYFKRCESFNDLSYEKID